MTLHALLATGFLFVGLSATLLMYHLWGYPYDAKRHRSSAPRGLTTLHRLLGLSFVAIYITMLVRMVPRLWHYEGELEARTVLHVALACLIGVLLTLKIFIIRFARHLGNALPWLGSAVLVSALLMLVMPLTMVAREWWISRGAQSAAARERVALAMAAAPDVFDAGIQPAVLIAEGRPLLHRHCTQCHDVRRIILERRDAPQWISLVERMRRHARAKSAIPPADGARVAAYLIAALGLDEIPAAADRTTAAAADEARGAAPPAASPPAAPPAAEPANGPRELPSAPAAPIDDAFAGVRRILDEHCIVCHAGPRAPEGARFETLEMILAERPGGPAVVVPGDPEASEMYRRVAGLSTPRMPITGPPWLSDEQIETVRAWIAAGARGAERGSTPGAEGSASAADERGPEPAAPVQAPAIEPEPEPEPAPEPAVDGVTFAQVRPILAMNCMRCHARDGILGRPPEGLRLTDLDGVLASAERPVVIPGNPGASLLVRHVRGLERPRMPFDGPPWLTDDEIVTLERWIAEGARDERGRPAPVPAGHEVRFEGTLTARWAVDGTRFVVGPGSEIRDARIGGRVELRAIVQPDGSLLAERVRGR